jgi:hypothetical protein
MAFKLRSQDEPSPAKQEDIVNPYKKKLDEYKLNDDGTYTGYFAQNINASRNTSQAKAQTKNIMKMIERGENAKAFAEGNKGGLFGSTKHIGKSRTTSSYSWSNNPSAKVNEKEVLNALKTHGGVDVTDNIVTPTNTRKVSKTINAKQHKMLEAKANQFQKIIDEKTAARTARNDKNQKSLATIEARKQALLEAKKQKLTNKNK